MPSKIPLLEPQFENGRDRADSCIKLTGYWLEGWRFKDGKWKFEEEVHLPHVGSAYFRCRVHLYAYGLRSVTKEEIQVGIEGIETTGHNLDGVLFAIGKGVFLTTIPLNLIWTMTNNESKNPCLHRTTGLFGLRLKPLGDLTLEILITYRNLNQLLRSERMFTENQDGFTWVGSSR